MDFTFTQTDRVLAVVQRDRGGRYRSNACPRFTPEADDASTDGAACRLDDAQACGAARASSLKREAIERKVVATPLCITAGQDVFGV
jgi:hypothetical protein